MIDKSSTEMYLKLHSFKVFQVKMEILQGMCVFPERQVLLVTPDGTHRDPPKPFLQGELSHSDVLTLSAKGGKSWSWVEMWRMQ